MNGLGSLRVALAIGTATLAKSLWTLAFAGVTVWRPDGRCILWIPACAGMTIQFDYTP